MRITIYRFWGGSKVAIECQFRPKRARWSGWDANFIDAHIDGDRVDLTADELERAEKAALAQIDEDIRYHKAISSAIAAETAPDY